MDLFRFAAGMGAAVMALVLGACAGSDGNNGADGADGAAGRSALMTVTAEPAGANCANGGSKVSAGQDGNGDGVLDASEVASTQYACNGASGATLPALVAMSDEGAGSNCVNGGKRIDVGIDSNGNNVLEAAEVTSTGYVCNGTNGVDGTNGTNGSNGLNSLVAIVAETAGANCSYGGSKITAGPDADADGQLDTGEVTSISYVCNPAPAGIAWVDVTGTAVQAEPNTGYIAHNDGARVTITLPANPAFGDIVRVSGLGAGGWKVAQNAGQTISARNLGVGAGATWTARDADRTWQSIASSADGGKLVAAVYGGQIYTSTDGGASWTARETARYWNSVASSADGSKLVAVVLEGNIYTSTDGGVSWTARDYPRRWQSVASSADGSKLVATTLDDLIFTSTDGGLTWTGRATEFTRRWGGVASSADGTKLVALKPGGAIYTSSDSGATWTPREFWRGWWAVATSSDGSKLVAVDRIGYIYTSADGGVTWTASDSPRNWASVASSADGVQIAAADRDGFLYTSNDSGLTWTPRDAGRPWSSVAMSSDGSRMVAGVYGGRIYTSAAWTTIGTVGGISGGQYDALELQYLGSGRFNVISHDGETMSIE
jgi:hypothetical protein